jgi:hypothetical protein
MNQAVVVASLLKELGYSNAENVPLEVWLKLHFLQRPSEKLIERLTKLLNEETT